MPIWYCVHFLWMPDSRDSFNLGYMILRDSGSPSWLADTLEIRCLYFINIHLAQKSRCKRLIVHTYTKLGTKSIDFQCHTWNSVMFKHMLHSASRLFVFCFENLGFRLILNAFFTHYVHKKKQNHSNEIKNTNKKWNNK